MEKFGLGISLEKHEECPKTREELISRLLRGVGSTISSRVDVYPHIFSFAEDAAKVEIKWNSVKRPIPSLWKRIKYVFNPDIRRLTF